MNVYDYRVHIDLNLIEVRPAGVVKISDILSYSKEMLSLDIVTEGTVEYYDLSEMTNLDLDYKSAYALNGELQQWLSRGWQGSVFFAPQAYQYGMIRMIAAVMESIQGAPNEMMIPRREPIALDEVRDFITECRKIS
jgi:hypothetical protein